MRFLVLVFSWLLVWTPPRRSQLCGAFGPFKDYRPAEDSPHRASRPGLRRTRRTRDRGGGEGVRRWGAPAPPPRAHVGGPRRVSVVDRVRSLVVSSTTDSPRSAIGRGRPGASPAGARKAPELGEAPNMRIVLFALPGVPAGGAGGCHASENTRDRRRRHPGIAVNLVNLSARRWRGPRCEKSATWGNPRAVHAWASCAWGRVDESPARTARTALGRAEARPRAETARRGAQSLSANGGPYGGKGASGTVRGGNRTDTPDRRRHAEIAPGGAQ